MYYEYTRVCKNPTRCHHLVILIIVDLEITILSEKCRITGNLFLAIFLRERKGTSENSNL